MPHGSTSFFRTIEPFSKLKKIDHNIDAQFIEALDWYLIADAEAVYFERPIEANFVEAVKKAKAFRKKVWVDYDDDLLNIPEGHPHYGYFQRPDIRRNLETILSIADVVSVTTQALEESFSKYSKNVVLIENAFDDYQFDMPEHSNVNPIVSWRGSDTHEMDLHEYEEALWEVAKKRENGWSWYFCGCNVQYITRNIKNFRHGGVLPLIEYYEVMKQIRPAIQVVPLLVNKFNMAKSNIGWLDGLVAGSVCVAPDLPEFRKPGVFTYGDDETLVAAMFQAMNPIEREKAFQKSREYVLENLTLSKINEKRVKVIHDLNLC